VKNVLQELDFITFNVFDLQRVSNGREFLIVGYEVIKPYYLLDKTGVNKYTYINFLDALG
jgi:hypothetical protein